MEAGEEVGHSFMYCLEESFARLDLVTYTGAFSVFELVIYNLFPDRKSVV